MVAALLGQPAAVLSERQAPRLTTLLVNLTVERSLWLVRVMLGVDATVADLARAAVAANIAEGRRPPLHTDANEVDATARFELHLSKYSLDALNLDENVLDLGSRNFFSAPEYSEWIIYTGPVQLKFDPFVLLMNCDSVLNDKAGLTPGGAEVVAEMAAI
ncbi:uncharacterized protein At4g22758-like [Lolium rigidum]|uniref:uncharacterized protein At4g22758-like n=1 Tax=Lolium rigidum TaxID=89674 RepID=UPI001F5CFC88|nr:uncharacterized protein At4g22758-like [Lolium rigidum]